MFGKKTFAWGVHLFTASGAVFSMLAILAIFAHDWQMTFVWIAATIIIDSFDGMLARFFQVKKFLPQFDGSLLDNIIDYQSYALVPALFLVEADLLSPNLGLLGAAMIVLTSGYQFAQANAKTDDHFFVGFPSYWNVLVFYLLVLQLPDWLTVGIILTCGVLVFVPIRYVYPSRTLYLRPLTMSLLFVWGGLMITALIQFPDVTPWLIPASLLFVVYYVGLSLYLMIRPSTPKQI